MPRQSTPHTLRSRVLLAAVMGLAYAIAPAPIARAEAALRRVGLAEALQAALDRNPDVVLARHELERADALVRSARGAAIPTLAGNGTYTRLDDDRSVGGNVLQHRNQLNLNALLTVPVVAPLRWTALR